VESFAKSFLKYSLRPSSEIEEPKDFSEVESEYTEGLKNAGVFRSSGKKCFFSGRKNP